MTKAIDRPALHEIEIGLDAVIPQKRTLAPDEDDRRARGNIHQCVERMGGDVHVETPCGWMKRVTKREKAARCGCGLLENVADLMLQRCRRTRRDPSSSNERRRKVARSWVLLSFMAMGHTAEGQALSSVREIGDPSQLKFKACSCGREHAVRPE